MRGKRASTQAMSCWGLECTGGAPTADSVSPSSGAGNSPNYTFTVIGFGSQFNISGMSMLITSGSPNNVGQRLLSGVQPHQCTIGLYADDGVTSQHQTDWLLGDTSKQPMRGGFHRHGHSGQFRHFHHQHRV